MDGGVVPEGESGPLVATFYAYPHRGHTFLLGPRELHEASIKRDLRSSERASQGWVYVVRSRGRNP